MKKSKKSKKAAPKAKTNEAKEKKESSDDFYTDEEIKKLDEFHEQTEHKFEDEEIYELMLKYKNDDEAILNDLKEQLKERKRGEQFDWQPVGKSKANNLINNYYFNIFL